MEDKFKLNNMRLVFNKSLSKEKQQTIQKNLRDLYSKERKFLEKKRSTKDIKEVKIPSYNIKPIRSNSAINIDKLNHVTQSIHNLIRMRINTP
jgi:hypothetical protein